MDAQADFDDLEAKFQESQRAAPAPDADLTARSQSEADAPEPAPTFGGMAKALGTVATIPSRAGAAAGRAMGERAARETPGKFGMESTPELEKKGGDVGEWLGHLGGKGLEILGLSSLMPGAAAGGAMETLGGMAARRAAHGAATFGAEGALESMANDGDAGDVAKAGGKGAALGAGLGLAGAVPGVAEFHLSPKMREGVMKAIMPRLLGTGAEAAVGGAYAAAEGGDKVDVAANAAMFGLLGFINNANYSAQARQAAKDSVIEPVVKAFVDSGAPPEMAVASARAALEQSLAQAGQASLAIKNHPNFPVFIDELAGRLRQAHPELNERQASILAESRAAQMFINGEVSIETLGKMKMEVKPAEAKPKEEPVPAVREEPAAIEQVPDAEAQAMESAIQAAQERGGGGSREAIAAALEMRPEAPPEAPAEVPHDAAETEAGDLSFFEEAPEDVLRAPATAEELAQGQKDATAPVHELAPQDLAQRFPDASPELQERLLRRVARSGYPISPEAAKAFPSLKADIAEGIREAALKTQEKESGPTRPATEMLRRLGGINKEGLAKFKELGEGVDLPRGVIKAGGEIKGWDHAAEILFNAGLIREQDTGMVMALLQEEAGRPLTRGAGPGAAAKGSLGARIRKPDLLPEEVVRTIQAAGIKVGGKVPLIREVKDPVFGKIKKGSEVTVLALDVEGGNAIVEWKDSEQILEPDIAVIPIDAMAKVVRNAPAPAAGAAEVKRDVLESTGVAKPEKTIKMTEIEALGSKLKAESKGAREATLVAQKEMRDRLLKESRAARRAMAEMRASLKHDLKEAVVNGKWEQATRNKIVEFAKAFLPPEARGTLLSKVANAKNPKDLLKAFWDIDQKSTLLTNKRMMKDIRILVDRVMASPTFPVGMKLKIREMLEDVRLENWSPKTIDKLRMQQEFVDELRADGVDVTVPQSILDRLSKLASRPLADMDSAELEEMLADLKFLVDQGKDIRSAIKNLDELMRLDKLEKLVAGTKKIEKPTTTKGVKRKFMGPALDWADSRKNTWLRMADFAQNAGIAITPIQVVVDDLDGTFLGGGPNRRVLWEPLQDGYVSHQTAISEAHDLLAKVLKEHGPLDPAQQDRATVVLMREQEGGREKLHQLGIEDPEIDAVNPTPQERATIDALRGYLNDPRRVNALTRVTAKLYNQEFVPVKNYWPMMTDFNAPKEGSTAVESILSQIDLRRKNVEKGMLIERVENAKQKIRSDVYAVFLAAAQQGSMIENMAEPILRAHELIRDPKYLEVAGDAGQTFWRDYLDVLSRDGKISAARRTWIIDFFRKNLGVAALSFKPQTALLQLSSMGSGATITGGAHLREALTAGPEWEGFVDEHMPLIRERKGGDPAVRDVMEGGLLPKVKEAGFKPIVKMDHFAAKQVALAAYFQWCDLHGVTPDPEKPAPAGLLYAQSVPGRAMASPWLIDMPLALSRGNITGNASIDRSALQFASETLAKFSLITHQVFGRGKKDKAGSAEALGWLGASLIYESGVRAAWVATVLGIMYSLGVITKKQFEDRVNANDLAFKNVALNALGTVPFVGSVGNYIAYDSGPIPLIDVMGDVFKGAANTTTGLAANKPYKSARGLIQALTATASLAGVPGAGLVGWIAKQPLRGKQDKKTKKGKGGSW